MPANTSAAVKSVRLLAAASCLRTEYAHIHNNGAANAMRQNAEAKGFTSDSRMKMPAKPIAIPPASKARKAIIGKGREAGMEDMDVRGNADDSASLLRF